MPPFGRDDRLSGWRARVLDDGASDRACPAQRPRCRIATGACVACTSNDDCGLAAPICDPTTLTCRVGCSSDAQCPGARCDLDTARCTVATDAGPDASADAGP